MKMQKLKLLFEEEKIREWFGKFCNPHNQQNPEMSKLGQIRLKTSDHFIAKWLGTLVASKVYFKMSNLLTQLIFFRENILLYYKVVMMLVSVYLSIHNLKNYWDIITSLSTNS